MNLVPITRHPLICKYPEIGKRCIGLCCATATKPGPNIFTACYYVIEAS